MKMEDGKIKYKCLPERVKSALILPHGNADVKRSLSVNTSVVTEDRPHIGEATVCAITANQNSQGCSRVLLSSQKSTSKSSPHKRAKMAYASYRERLDNNKEEKG